MNAVLIQLPQENSSNNKTKLYNNVVKTICKKMTFAQLKANDISTPGKSSIWLSSRPLKTERDFFTYNMDGSQQIY